MTPNRNPGSLAAEPGQVDDTVNRNNTNYSSYCQEVLRAIQVDGLRIDYRGQLLVPFIEYDQLSTLQTIDAQGNKKFLPKKRGCYAKGSSFIIDGDPSCVCFAEGVATAADINKATGATVVVVGMKSNFIPVCNHIQHQLNGAEIFLCADNDEDEGYWRGWCRVVLIIRNMGWLTRQLLSLRICNT